MVLTIPRLKYARVKLCAVHIPDKLPVNKGFDAQVTEKTHAQHVVFRWLSEWGEVQSAYIHRDISFVF